MDLKNKKVLVIGMARSGIASAELLLEKGAKVYINDVKPQEGFDGALDKIIENGAVVCLGTSPEEIAHEMDLIVLSPAVKTDAKFLDKAKENGVKIIGELELGYQQSKGTFIAITGTNGKTTTTTLVAEIFKEAGNNTFALGNIGESVAAHALETKDTDIIVTEVSSFQLLTIEKFHPKVSAVLNITEDHMDRHYTMENYIDAKLSVYKNQDESDFVVVNVDDAILKTCTIDTKSTVLQFGIYNAVDKGAYVKDGIIYFDKGNGPVEICEPDDIYIPGEHNLYNALAAVCVAGAMDVEPAVIKKTLQTFKGVEHRIETVCTHNGVTYINDSKGTNPDAAIKAIEAMKVPTVLIAGGYDKHADFGDFIESAKKGKIKHMVIIGQTADQIVKTALEHGFDKFTRADSMENAVKISSEIAEPGENVLLSPACASWDMFSDYEQRGRIFKQIAKSLGGNNGEASN